MATPVYGKQFIRFAETGIAKGMSELPAFRVVKIDNSVPTEPPTVELSDGGESFGVLQQEVPDYDHDKATTISRLCTVATSGLLLIEAAAAPGGPVQNDILECERRRSRRGSWLRRRCDCERYHSYRSPSGDDRWCEPRSRQLQLSLLTRAWLQPFSVRPSSSSSAEGDIKDNDES